MTGIFVYVQIRHQRYCQKIGMSGHHHWLRLRWQQLV